MDKILHNFLYVINWKKVPDFLDCPKLEKTRLNTRLDLGIETEVTMKFSPRFLAAWVILADRRDKGFGGPDRINWVIIIEFNLNSWAIQD